MTALMYIAYMSWQTDASDEVRHCFSCYKTAINRWITRKRHPNDNPNVHSVHELADGCL